MSTQPSPTAPFKTPHDEMVPRVVGRFLLGLMAAALILVSLAVLTNRPLDATPPEQAVVTTRVLYLSGDMSGAAQVRGEDGAMIADLGPTEGGFVSGVWRVVQRERTKHGAASDGPVHLIRTEGGRISILDPSTNWRADLMGFGADNARAFAKLLD